MAIQIPIQRSAFLEAIQKHDPSSTAVVNHESGTVFSYGRLLEDVACSKERLLKAIDRPSISGDRIGFLVENSYNYVGTNHISPLLTVRFQALTVVHSDTPVDNRMQCCCCTIGTVFSRH